MSQKRHIIGALFFSILFLSGCEKDDLCSGQDNATPLVVFGFYNQSNVTERKVFQNIVCYEAGRTSNDSIAFSNASTIKLPLKINGSETVWVLKLKQTTGNVTTEINDTIRFNYSTTSEYVSKACGYKTIFMNVNTTLNNGNPGHWIISQESVNQIVNETNEHVTILY